jgi:hypothetical protein
MNTSDPFSPIAKELAKFRNSNPHTRRFPLALWQKIVPLAQEYTVSEISHRLQISAGNLSRRIQRLKTNKRPTSSKLPLLVEFPLPASRPCIMELEYPSGVKVRLFAQ